MHWVASTVLEGTTELVSKLIEDLLYCIYTFI